MFKKRFKTDIAGISHHKKALYALDLNKDDYVVELIEEPTNKYDPNAIKVIVDGQHIGYIPAKKCAKVKTTLSPSYAIAWTVDMVLMASTHSGYRRT